MNEGIPLPLTPRKTAQHPRHRNNRRPAAEMQPAFCAGAARALNHGGAVGGQTACRCEAWPQKMQPRGVRNPLAMLRMAHLPLSGGALTRIQMSAGLLNRSLGGSWEPPRHASHGPSPPFRGRPDETSAECGFVRTMRYFSVGAGVDTRFDSDYDKTDRKPQTSHP